MQRRQIVVRYGGEQMMFEMVADMMRIEHEARDRIVGNDCARIL